MGEATLGARVIPTAIDPRPVAARLRITAFYPNPVSTEATLAFSAGSAGSVRVSIYNVLGQRVRQDVLTAGAGANRHNLSVPGLAPGTYLLEVRATAGEAAVRAFAIVR